MEDTSHPTSPESSKLSLKLLHEITKYKSEELGSGPFGKVYKGMLKDGQVIAMKVLRYKSALDDVQFENVCEQLRSLKHENLVQLVGFCNEPEEGLTQGSRGRIRVVFIHRALCLEFVPNGSLSNFLSEERYLGVNWQVCFKIIKGISEGLQYLHEASIMHLDLKPENILLDDKMTPKITDFGLSELLGKENTAVAVSSQWTRAFVPPEFLTRRHISYEFDIFSLGAIIKKILTGVMDYLSIDDIEDDEEKIELVHNVWKKKLQKRREYPSLEVDCKQVRTCITIALNCMNSDKHKRPPMKDIVRELHEAESRENGQIEEGIPEDKLEYVSFNELNRITNNRSEKLGQDGLGAVYKGKLTNGKLVAVKILYKHSGELYNQFERLVMNLERFKHKNIVRLKAYCYENCRQLVPGDKNPEIRTIQFVSESFLCYEFLPNGSMDSVIRDKSRKLDWRSRHTIIRGICEGLHYLHEICQDSPVVHDDLKSSNILLDKDMVPKLGGFGLSRMYHKQTHIARNRALQPREYRAPEFMASDVADVKSNIYSLGLIIIEIITGDKCPQDDSSGRSYIEKVIKARMEDSYVSSKYPSLEVGFVQQVRCWINIGLKCVEIQPNKRLNIRQIMYFLETESANPEYYDYGELNHSSINNITSWPSLELGDHVNELDALEGMLSDASAEPRILSYVLLKSVTRNFSRMIGSGGFGAVYLGILRKGNVAVKKLSVLREFSNQAFADELKCLQKINHNNVVRLLGYCAVAHGELVEFNGTHVLAEEPQRLLCFEYIPNGNLEHYIREKSHGDEWKIRYQMIKGICHGLHYLHKQRISHLDLKPENVLLDANMEPIITDFGLSRFLDKGKSIIVTKNICGTPGSIAPELIDSGKISFKSDIYSLGIIITKLLMRDTTYDFDNWHKLLEVSCLQEKRCVEIAKRCVKYSQDKRPTIVEIIHELNEIDNMIPEVSSLVIQ